MTIKTLSARGRRRQREPEPTKEVILRRLRDYRALGRRIERIEQRLEELEAPIYDPRTPQLTGMPHAPTARPGSAQERVADATADLRATYLHQIARLRAEAGELETALDELEPPILGDVLRRRYIDGLTIRQTAAAMMYSEPQIYVLQRRALAQLAQK